MSKLGASNSLGDHEGVGLFLRIENGRERGRWVVGGGGAEGLHDFDIVK